jgi:nucleoid-associated protein YgaU
MFFSGSRYERVPTRETVLPDGRRVQYKAIRLITPPPARSRHVVVDGDRLDLIAHRYLRDPQRFWRICDTNRVLRPAELTEEPGLWIGIPGPGD